VGGEAGTEAPFFERSGVEEPVTGVGEGCFDIVPAGVAVREAEGPEAVCIVQLVAMEGNGWHGDAERLPHLLFPRAALSPHRCEGRELSRLQTREG